MSPESARKVLAWVALSACIYAGMVLADAIDPPTPNG